MSLKLDGGCLAWTVVASSFMVSFIQGGFRFCNMFHLWSPKKFFPPCHELHVEDGLNCVAFGVFSSECFIFQLLLWHSPARHCRSFQCWSRRGRPHLLLDDFYHRWIRSALLCNEIAFFSLILIFDKQPTSPPKKNKDNPSATFWRPPLLGVYDK